MKGQTTVPYTANGNRLTPVTPGILSDLAICPNVSQILEVFLISCCEKVTII